MTIEMSVGKLSERARDVMRLFAHLQATSISHSMIVKAAECRFRRVEQTKASCLNPETLKQADVLEKIFCPGGEWSEFDFNEPIHECLQYSLLQLTTQDDAKFYSMHVLVQSHLQGTGLIHDHEPKRLVCRLLGSAVTIGKPYEFLGFNRIILPHIRLVRIEDVIEAGDHYGLGRVLNEVGDARLAIDHEEKCVEMWRGLLGKEDGCTIRAMGNLALSYKDMGKYQAAVDLEEEVLALWKRLLGPEHPATLLVMSYLTTSYTYVGKYQAALELGEEVLSLRRQLLGPEHPDTIWAMGNLALPYKSMGKYQAALELEEVVLSLRRRLLGPEHPDTLLALSNLTYSYNFAGKYQAALELSEEVLSLRKRILGPEHPATSIAMGNLGVAYMRVGKDQAALELLEEALSPQARLLGPQHPDTITTMRRLLFTYHKLNMHAQKLSLLRTAVPAHEASESYGIDHPDTVELRNELVDLSAHITDGSD